MKARWGLIAALLVTALAVIPLATAGAQAPPSTGAPATEGSIPPGGTVNCEESVTLTPDQGPPGTIVEVVGTFSGNCDDVNPVFLTDMECVGQVTGGGLEEFTFPVVVTFGEPDVTISGTFTAPAVPPDPPVVDAIEDLAVTVTCTVGCPTPVLTGAEGCTITAEGDFPETTYVYPPANFALELFADPDSDQPTLVDNDGDGIPDDIDDDVVDATPTFTG